MLKKVKSAFNCVTAPADAPVDVTKASFTNPSKTGPGNERNNAMVREVAAFSKHVQLLHANITGWSQAFDSGLGSLRVVMEAPLPKAFDDTATGVKPFDGGNHVVGHNVDTASFPKTASSMRSNLQEEVLEPLECWLQAYRAIKERNKKCQALYAEVQIQKKLAGKLQSKAQVLQSVKSAPLDKDAEKAEKTLIAMQTEEDKLTRLQQRYAELEAEVFNALLALIRDSHVLREYAAGALAIMQNVFHTTYQAFDLEAESDPYLLPPEAVPQVKLPEPMYAKLPAALSAPLAKPVLYEQRQSLRQSIDMYNAGRDSMSPYSPATNLTPTYSPEHVSPEANSATPPRSAADRQAESMEVAAALFNTPTGAKTPAPTAAVVAHAAEADAAADAAIAARSYVEPDLRSVRSLAAAQAVAAGDADGAGTEAAALAAAIDAAAEEAAVLPQAADSMGAPAAAVAAEDFDAAGWKSGGAEGSFEKQADAAAQHMAAANGHLAGAAGHATAASSQAPMDAAAVAVEHSIAETAPAPATAAAAVEAHAAALASNTAIAPPNLAAEHAQSIKEHDAEAEVTVALAPIPAAAYSSSPPAIRVNDVYEENPFGAAK